MKKALMKSLMLVVALVCSMALAKAQIVYDTNFALASGATATASSGDAGAAIDGNNGTRWESAHVDSTWFQLDLGQARVFNTIQIRWEGAYTKEFALLAGNDPAALDTIQKVDRTGIANNDEETFTFDNDITARYVKFVSFKRATMWGNSFYEFRVLYPGVSVLTSFNATAGNLCKVGVDNPITFAAKDQNGGAMTVAPTYTVNPADAGTFNGNAFVAAKGGTAVITATATLGEVTLTSTINVFAYAGENVVGCNALPESKIIAQSAVDPNGSDKDAFFAIDFDEGSVWQGSPTGNTGEDEASRTYDSWFVADLGAYYDVELVTINFEGACSQNYTLDFSADNTTWANAYTYAGNAGVWGHVDMIYPGGAQELNNNLKVRYVRFHSTKAATQYGMKIFYFKVFGTPWTAPTDVEKPVMGAASLVSAGYNSAVIAVAATDNEEVRDFHVVDAANGLDVYKSAAEGQITLTGLTANTTYNLTITARDLALNESDNSTTVTLTTASHFERPATAVAAPTAPANRVMKVYSDAYAGAEFSAHEGWGDATVYEEITLGENDHVRLYSNLNYLGWAGAPINAINMEYLHIDIWAEEDGQLGIVPIFGGEGLVTDDSHRKIVTLVGQQWNSFDLELATEFEGLPLTSIFQFKFDNATGNHFGIDNVYFYRTTDIVDTEAPQNAYAVAGAASYFHAAIKASATDNMGAVTYVVKNGETEVARKVANSGDTTEIIVPGLVPATAYNFSVVAMDGSENAAAAIAVAVTTLAAPAAAPAPTEAAANVVSLYSDAYAFAPASLQSYNEGWWDAPSMEEGALAENEHVLYYYGRLTGMIGWQFAEVDATGATSFSIDIYPAQSGHITVGPLNEGAGDYAEVHEVVGGQWNTVTVDLTGKDLSKLYQVKMIAYTEIGEFFIDNAYVVVPAPAPVPEAPHYAITFKGYPNTGSDDSHSYTTATPAADFIVDGLEHVASIDSISKVYAARVSKVDSISLGLKFGSSSAVGYFQISLDAVCDSFAISAAQYNATAGYMLVNGDTMQLTAGNKVFQRQTFVGAQTITLETTTDYYRTYVDSIIVYYHEDKPEPVEQMIGNPVGADGRFIVKYDMAAGKFAAANDMEIGETFTFAIDVTGSWLEEWLAAPATTANAQRGLAINKWTSRGDLNGNAVRFKHIKGNIWGMQVNFAQQAQNGWEVDALKTDSTTTVYAQLFGFEYTAQSAGAAWWQWDGHEVVTTQAVGTDGLFAFAPSTGKQDAAFTTADMTGDMYGYNEPGYAAPGAILRPTEPFDHDLYNPAEAAISSSYFATTAWAVETESTVALDNETGDINVHIAQEKAAQWQSQVFITPGFEWETGATYEVEFKLFTTNGLGGVTVKVNNDGEGWYYSYPNDNTFLANQYTTFNTGEFVAGEKGATGLGELIFSFGWVAANTDIIISDIRISKTKDAETAIDNLDAVSSVKVLRDGQIIILRGAHEYNAQGMLLK